MEDQTINRLFSVLTFLLLPTSSDQYSPLLYPDYTTSNTTSPFLILSSDPSYCYYKHQPNTITAISGIKDYKAPSSGCDNEGYDREYQNGRHFSIFGEDAYNIVTTLKNASL
jgi:hypothetical protein